MVPVSCLFLRHTSERKVPNLLSVSMSEVNNLPQTKVSAESSVEGDVRKRKKMDDYVDAVDITFTPEELKTIALRLKSSMLNYFALKFDLFVNTIYF